MSREREREPHPDPAIELQLQEILDLRASTDRRGALIEQYREEIADLHKDARYNDNNERIKIFYERADQLDETATLITDSGLPPHRLQLEVTEHAVMTADLETVSVPEL